MEDVPRLRNQADSPEVRSAWEGSIGTHVRTEETAGMEMLYVARTVPGLRDGRVVIRMGPPLNQPGPLQDRIDRAILLATLLGLALALLLTYSVSRSVSRPLRKLSGVTRSIGAGDFDERVPSDASPREIRDLARALDSTGSRSGTGSRTSSGKRRDSRRFSRT